jgi:hypothetical protein
MFDLDSWRVRTPEDPNTWIWRYIDVAKFVDLLRRRKLYFARISRLSDPFEGSMSHAARDILRLWERDFWPPAVPGAPTSESIEQGTFKANQEFARVNCWHMNECESMAMWELYGSRGIAIRSTFRRLVDSLTGNSAQIFFGMVSYQDRRKTGHFESADFLTPLFRKGLSYQHEQELRAVSITLGPQDGYADVDLDVLIEEVYVGPGRPEWFRELVAGLIHDYNVECAVAPSALDDRPELT